MKCDEGKPGCRKCDRIGRPCGGYSATALANRAVNCSLIQEPCHVLTTLFGEADLQEQRMFHWFYTTAINEIAGSTDREFWVTMMPHASQRHKPIWHATMALSSMHIRSLMLEGKDAAHSVSINEPDNHYTFALKHYNISIQRLVNMVQEPDLTYLDQEILLLATILFSVLSCINADTKQAIMHVYYGLRLYRQWEFKQYWPAVAPDRTMGANPFIAFFDFFNYEYFWADASRPLLPQRNMQQTAGAIQATVEVTDGPHIDLCELRQQAKRAWCDGTTISERMPSVPATYLDAAQSHDRQFSHSSFTSRHQEGGSQCALVVNLWLAGKEIELHVDFDGMDMDCRLFRSSFTSIIRLAQQLIDEPSMQSQERLSIVLPFRGMGGCKPFCMIGSHCCGNKSSHSSMALLNPWPRKNGFWDSTIVTMKVEAGSYVREGGMLWHDETRVNECDCVLGIRVCEYHDIKGSDITFLRWGGARFIMQTIGEAVEFRLCHVVTVFW